MTFRRDYVAQPDNIDELDHVNNAVWVRWIQDIATAHWLAVARDDDVGRYIWVIVRHVIDYRGNLKLGEQCCGEPWVPDPPRGARFDRHVRFIRAGRIVVDAVSTRAMIDRTTGRPARVPVALAGELLEPRR